MLTKSSILNILFLSTLLKLTESICSGSQYWNPLNNACVDSNNNIYIFYRMPMGLSKFILCRSIYKYVCIKMSYYS